jgi:hypothetical protein
MLIRQQHHMPWKPKAATIADYDSRIQPMKHASRNSPWCRVIS